MSEINAGFDALMIECIILCDDDLLPGTQTKKANVMTAKIEFDARVKDWLGRIELDGTASACFDAPDPLPMSSHGLGDVQFRCSRRSRHSTSSSVSYKRKEGLVKVKLAMFAKKRELERSRMAVKAEEMLEEAAKNLELAVREAKKVQESLKRTTLQQEKAWDAEMAVLEAEAWAEVASQSGMDIVPSNSQDQWKSVNVPVTRSDQSCWWSWQRSAGNPLAARVLTSMPYPASNTNKLRGKSEEFVPPVRQVNFAHDVRVHSYLNTAGCQMSSSNGHNHTVLSQRYTPPNDANLTFRDGQAAPLIMMTSQDYPPPRPVIPTFDGDPVNYWPFICSFETHIAQKMTSDSAKLSLQN